MLPFATFSVESALAAKASKGNRIRSAVVGGGAVRKAGPSL